MPSAGGDGTNTLKCLQHKELVVGGASARGPRCPFFQASRAGPLLLPSPGEGRMPWPPRQGRGRQSRGDRRGPEGVLWETLARGLGTTWLGAVACPLLGAQALRPGPLSSCVLSCQSERRRPAYRPYSCSGTGPFRVARRLQRIVRTVRGGVLRIARRPPARLDRPCASASAGGSACCGGRRGS